MKLSCELSSVSQALGRRLAIAQVQQSNCALLTICSLLCVLRVSFRQLLKHNCREVAIFWYVHGSYHALTKITDVVIRCLSTYNNVYRGIR